MARKTGIRIGLVAILSLVVLAGVFLLFRPTLIDQRAITKALSVQLSSWAGAAVTLNGPIDVQYFPRLQVKTGAVFVSGVTRLPSIRKFEAKGALLRLDLSSLISKTPIVNRVTLLQPVIEATTAVAPGEKTKAVDDTEALMAAVTEAPIPGIYLDAGQIKVSGQSTTEMFDDVTIKVDLEPNGALSTRGNFVWRGKPVEFRYSGKAPRPGTGTTLIPLTLDINGEFGSASISGQANLGDTVAMDGEMALDIASATSFARWTGVLVPEDQKVGPLTADGKFRWEGRRIEFDQGTFSLDGNRAIGTLALEMSGTRPKVEGTIALQKLDITPYLPSPQKKPAKVVKAEKKTDSAKEALNIPAVHLDFPILHHFNFDVRISTADLLIGKLGLGQSALAVSLDAGKLAADLAVFEFCNGTANSRIELDATVSKSALKVSATGRGIAAKPCVENFMSDSPVDGNADVVAEFTSSGRSGADLVENLRGKTKVTITSGNLTLDIPGMFAQASNKAINGWENATGSQTTFKSLATTVFLRQNSFYFDALKAEIDTGLISGNGDIDFSSRTLDVELEFSKIPEQPGATDTVLSAPDSPQASTQRLTIKGPWSKPTFAKGIAQSGSTATPSRSIVQTSAQPVEDSR